MVHVYQALLKKINNIIVLCTQSDFKKISSVPKFLNMKIPIKMHKLVFRFKPNQYKIT